MKLRTDAIGHFDIPTEANIRDALACSKENDLIKLMTDDEHFLSIWFGKQSTDHILILSRARGSSNVVKNYLLK